MTREEAIKILQRTKHSYDTMPKALRKVMAKYPPNADECSQAVDMAIESLSADQPQGEDWEKYSEKLWKSAYERGLNDQSKLEEIIERITNYRNAVAEEHTDEEAELLDPEDWYYDDGYLNALNYALSILEEVKYSEYGTGI